MLNIKILVVTTDAKSASLFSDILSPSHQVKIVLSGQEAIKSASQFLPDIILLDRELSDMSGDTVGKTISEDETLQPVKIVMISQHSSQNDIRDGFFAGADYYLAKPLEREKLLALIKRIINAQVNDPVKNRYL